MQGRWLLRFACARFSCVCMFFLREMACACTHVCLYVCGMCVGISLCVCTCNQEHIYTVSTHTHTHTEAYTLTDHTYHLSAITRHQGVRIHTQTYTSTHTHTPTHTHTHTHTVAHIPVYLAHASGETVTSPSLVSTETLLLPLAIFCNCSVTESSKGTVYGCIQGCMLFRIVFYAIVCIYIHTHI